MKTGEYPPNWNQIARSLKEANGWICERCKHPHDVPSGHVLTVHHLDGNPSNNDHWNLAVLCQRCHLHIQNKVKMEQLFFSEILDVSEWFKPHLKGYLSSLMGTLHKGSMTPLTDAAAMPIDRVDIEASRPAEIVNADFARSLEAELVNLRHEMQCLSKDWVERASLTRLEYKGLSKAEAEKLLKVAITLQNCSSELQIAMKRVTPKKPS